MRTVCWIRRGAGERCGDQPTSCTPDRDSLINRQDMAMDRQAFDTVQSGVMRARQPYSSQSLDDMIMDVDHALLQEGFRLIGDVTKTGEPQSMLLVTCVPETETVSWADVRSALERAWVEHAAFDEEAHVMDEDEQQIRLDFVTWWPRPGGRYVTGRIAVDVSRDVAQGSSGRR